jgi:endonuclease I
MKRFLALSLLLLNILYAAAQIPAGYYNSAIGLTGTPLKQALHNIIKNHTVVSYSSLLTYFQTTDVKPNGKVWDMYSDVPNGTPPYEYTFGQSCGNYSGESDCYNREHTWPQSWFNSASPMVSDIFHIYPTDGYVNGRRGNDPYSTVSTPTWISMNGGKLGPSTYPGYTGQAFEPIDEYKGDIARSYFYMSVRYYTEDAAWQNSPMVTKAELNPWAVNLLLQWNNDDPVSQKEIDRNNDIYYNIQHNRNPFIDHPEYAAEIWSSSAGITDAYASLSCTVYPNPSLDGIYHLSMNATQAAVVYVYTVTGQEIEHEEVKGSSADIDLATSPQGVYFLKIVSGNKSFNKLLVKP